MSEPRPIVYWIKCDHDLKPNKYSFVDLDSMLKTLQRLIVDRGPIEFMVRES